MMGDVPPAKEKPLPAFSHVNLLEVEDSVSGRADGIEGRFARKHLDSRDLGVSHWRYAPGFRAGTGHRHRVQEEAYVVASGSGRLLVDGEVIELREWDVVRVAPEAVRAFAAGDDGLVVIAIGGPKPEGGDGEPVEVEWPA
jgi:mannose-6-phosphate isomerase-like protein (cupin superfamily)